jgi:hypothetical protein
VTTGLESADCTGIDCKIKQDYIKNLLTELGKKGFKWFRHAEGMAIIWILKGH